MRIRKIINGLFYFGFLAWTFGVILELIDPPTYRDLTVAALAALTISVGNAGDILTLKKVSQGTLATLRALLTFTGKPKS